MLSTTPPRADDEAEAEPPSRPALLLQIAVVAAYAGVSILRPALPSNLAYVDVAIAAICLVSLLSMAKTGSPATRSAVRAMPWLWLILVGSFLGMWSVGITGWGIADLLRTNFAVLAFFCIWHLMYVARLERYAIWGTAIGLGITSVALLVQPFKYRGRAFFENPNYAGHYCVMAAFLLFFAGKRWYLHAIAAFGLAMAIWQTGSFGAVAMSLSMLAVVLVRSVTRNTAVLAVGLVVLAVVGLFLLSPGADSVSSGNGSWQISSSLSSDRLDKSQGSRISIWSDAWNAWVKEPLGVGPDGVHQRQLAMINGHFLEIHNDALGYLVERGPLGFIGFIGFWVVIWRSSRRRGLARIFIVGALVQGMFRETFHYRHMWLIIAVAFVLDSRRQQADDEAEAELSGEPAIGGALA
ncbi:MAG: O-antigen ligase family protein [Acidimicrobiales bacterium]